MNASLARFAVPALAVVVFAVLLGWFGLRRLDTNVARPASIASGTAKTVEATVSPETAKVLEPAKTPDATKLPDAAKSPDTVKSPDTAKSLDAVKSLDAAKSLASPDNPKAPGTAGAAGPGLANRDGVAQGKSAAGAVRPDTPVSPPPFPPPGDVAKAGARPGAASEEGNAALPSFDIVRVEPSGESVIAGRAAPGATVDLLTNGTPLARQMADPSGLFAFVPPALPPGSHEVTLHTIAPDGTRARSPQSVTVVIAAKRDTRPLVAVSTPGQPTVVLSQPDTAKVADAPPSALPSIGVAPAPGGPIASALPVPPATRPSAPQAKTAAPATAAPTAASPAGSRADAQPAPSSRARVRIASVDAEGAGRLFVSGTAAPGATLRLYLNDAYVAPGGTDPDGRVSFTIERGIRPGEYQVRLDDVDPVNGSVRSRAEVPFTVPEPTSVAALEPAVEAGRVAAGTRTSPQGSAGASTPEPAPIRAVPTAPAAETLRGVAPTGPLEPPGAVGPSEPTVAPAPPTYAPGARAPDAGTLEADARSPRSLSATTPPTKQPAIGTVVVPEVATALVSRGDNLWRISKRTYGSGLRYTVIFDANSPQIRNPALIYPGQIFVLPPGGTPPGSRGTPATAPGASAKPATAPAAGR